MDMGKKNTMDARKTRTHAKDEAATLRRLLAAGRCGYTPRTIIHAHAR